MDRPGPGAHRDVHRVGRRDADGQVDLVVDHRLIHVGQDHRQVRRRDVRHRGLRVDVRVGRVPVGLIHRQRLRRQVRVRALEVQRRQADLLEVVDALGAPGRLAGRLHRRQQERDQHGDDRDHHQQLDQRETTRASPCVRKSFPCGILHESEYQKLCAVLDHKTGRSPSFIFDRSISQLERPAVDSTRGLTSAWSSGLIDVEVAALEPVGPRAQATSLHQLGLSPGLHRRHAVARLIPPLDQYRIVARAAHPQPRSSELSSKLPSSSTIP